MDEINYRGFRWVQVDLFLLWLPKGGGAVTISRKSVDRTWDISFHYRAGGGEYIDHDGDLQWCIDHAREVWYGTDDGEPEEER